MLRASLNGSIFITEKLQTSIVTELDGHLTATVGSVSDLELRPVFVDRVQDKPRPSYFQLCRKERNILFFYR